MGARCQSEGLKVSSGLESIRHQAPAGCRFLHILLSITSCSTCACDPTIEIGILAEETGSDAAAESSSGKGAIALKSAERLRGFLAFSEKC